jgi:hypothetical protein
MRHGSAPRGVVFIPHDIIGLPGDPDHPGRRLSDPRPHFERPGRCHQAAGYSTNDAASVRSVFEIHKTVVFTIKLQGGQWTEFESDDGGPDQVGDLGTYTVTSDVLAMTGDGGKGHQRLKWTLDGIALSLETLPGDPQGDAAAPVAIFTSGPFYREG